MIQENSPGAEPENLEPEISESEAPEQSEPPKKKMGKLRAFFFNRKTEREFKKETARTEIGPEEVKTDKPAKDTRKINQFLSAIEDQLDKVDEQNKILLLHLSTVRENNETLLEQVKVLSKNNDQLFKQFQASRKREKAAKIIAIVSSSLAIGYTLYRIIAALVGNGG